MHRADQLKHIRWGWDNLSAGQKIKLSFLVSRWRFEALVHETALNIAFPIKGFGVLVNGIIADANYESSRWLGYNPIGKNILDMVVENQHTQIMQRLGYGIFEPAVMSVRAKKGLLIVRIIPEPVKWGGVAARYSSIQVFQHA